MNNSSRRGQVTAFILIGLILLVVLIFFFSLRRAATQSTTKVGTFERSYDRAVVEPYVDRCIDLAADQGFTLLGRQGGLIFEEQGGLATHGALQEQLDLSTGQTRVMPLNLSFGLINDSGSPFRPKFAAQYPPNGNQSYYPFPDVTLASLRPPVNRSANPVSQWAGLQYDGPFGQYALPPLCDPAGPNALTLTNPNLRCDPRLFPGDGRPSVQASLEEYVTNGLVACIDTGELSKLLGASVSMERPTVNVTFARQATLVDVDLPLRFADDAGNLRAASFSRQYPVRLYALYSYAFHILKQASKNPFFRFANASSYADVSGYDRFAVNLAPAQPAQAHGRKDLFFVSIVDPASIVGKGGWSLQFLVQDRTPVLGLTPIIDLSSLATPGTSVSIPVSAVDPDGDPPAVNLSANLVFNNTDLRQDFTVTSSPDPLTLNIKMTNYVCGGVYYANLSVNDSVGLTDWQTVFVKITPCPSS